MKKTRYLAIGLLAAFALFLIACGGSGGKESTSPSPQASAVPGDAGSGKVAYADLNELDSYRLEWTVKRKVGDDYVVGGYKLEWTKKPLATHLTMEMGGGMALEYILADGGVWLKAGGEWMEASKEDLDDAIREIGDVVQPEEEMKFLGKEKVNGVDCKRYSKETKTKEFTSRHDVWIADQKGLPPVVVRGIFRMTGAVEQTMESNVTDINAPITIKVPK